MKVVFLQSVGSRGRVGEIKDVPDGYARNFLIPKKLAVVATPAAIQAAHRAEESRHRKKERHVSRLKVLFQKIQTLKMRVKAKTNADGKLFAALRPEQIVAELKTKKYDFPVHAIFFERPLKTTGTHQVQIRDGNEFLGELTIEIVGESVTGL